jgi:hypothetical protein
MNKIILSIMKNPVNPVQLTFSHQARESTSTSSYQQRVHQRCDAFRSSSEYSAESGKRLTTSRSSSLKSVHRFSPRFSHRGQLSCDFMLNNSDPLKLVIYYQTILV